MNPPPPRQASVSPKALGTHHGQAPEIRGGAAFTAPPSLGFRILAFGFDLGFSGCLYTSYFLIIQALPSLVGGYGLMLLKWLVFAVISGMFQKFIWGVTLGEQLWDFRARARFQWNPPIFQR